jgi:hypothetical protein
MDFRETLEGLDEFQVVTEEKHLRSELFDSPA